MVALQLLFHLIAPLENSIELCVVLFFFFLPDVSGLFFYKVYYGLIVFPQNPHTENLMPKVMVLGITMNSHKWN